MKNVLKSCRLILTLKCDESTRIVSESLDRDLSGTERWAVRLHYISCWSCRRFRQQLIIMRKALKVFDSNDESAPGLTVDAKTRIENAINQAK